MIDIEITKLYEGQPSKYIAVAVSTTGIVTMVPLGLGIIWYENNKDNRTLVNQLVSALIWRSVLFSLLVQTTDNLLYIIGPLPEALCTLEIFLRSSLTMQGILYLDSIFVVRYLFVFHLKNPTAAQDDFWALFLNMWTTAAGVLTQSLFLYLPGKNPNDYYICIGRLPAKMVTAPMKVNYSLVFMTLFSVLANFAVALRFKVFKIREKMKASVGSVDGKRTYFEQVNRSYLVNFTSNAVGIITYFLASLPPMKMNRMDPSKFNEYPDYLWIYGFHHYILVSVQALNIGKFYAIHRQLRFTVFRSLKDAIGY